jgi:hypothetical protein
MQGNMPHHGDDADDEGGLALDAIFTVSLEPLPFHTAAVSLVFVPNQKKKKNPSSPS